MFKVIGVVGIVAAAVAVVASGILYFLYLYLGDIYIYIYIYTCTVVFMLLWWWWDKEVFFERSFVVNIYRRDDLDCRNYSWHLTTFLRGQQPQNCCFNKSV